MVQTTTSGWRARELISLSRIRIAESGSNYVILRESCRWLPVFPLARFRKAIRAKVKNTCCVARIISLMSYWLPLTAV